MMNTHSCSSKTDYTNIFCIPKLGENHQFHNSNVNNACRNNYPVTFTFMENQGNSLNNTEIMKVDEHTFMLIKTDYTNKFSILKWSENSPFHNFNVTHVSRNNYQVTFLNGKSRKLTEDEWNHESWWTYIHSHLKQNAAMNSPYQN